MAKSPVSEIDKNVGKRIQQRRKEQQLSIAVLSECLDLSVQQLSRYERGVNKIPLANLVLIAHQLETPISWFLIDNELVYNKKSTYKLFDTKASYNSTNYQHADLEKRLIQQFTSLSIEQIRLLVLFLDSIK